MFKKQFQVKPRTPIKTSACRRLVQECKEMYPAAWPAAAELTTENDQQKETNDNTAQDADETAAEANAKDIDQQIDQIDHEEALVPMPSKLQMAKFVSHVGEKGEILYDSTGTPLWFKAEPHGGNKVQVLFPTVYTLWRFPGMLPILWTPQMVVEKLIGGADLMVPGIIVPSGGLPDLKSSTVVAICSPGNLAAQAVGVLALDTKDLRVVAGAKGKAVLISHTFKDHLWQSGSKESLPEITGPSTAKDGQSDEAENNEINSGQKESSTTESGHRQDITLSAHDVDQQDDKDSSGNHEDKAEEETMSPAEMDALLMLVLKQTMATVLNAENASALMPINASTLYSNFMTPNAPRGKTVDIKRSSYKKLAKFLKAAEKSGLVKLKDIRGELHVKSFDYKHREMASFEPYKVARAKSEKTASGEKQAANSGAKSGQAPSASAAAVASTAHMVQVIEYFKPSHGLAPLFDDVGAQTETGFFTRQQARDVLEQYIKGQNLVDARNPRMVKLDHRLCDGLLSKEEYAKLDAMPRDQLQTRLQEKMTLYTQVVVPGKTPIAPKIGRPAAVEIVCEKKMGTKVLTRIVGLETYEIDPAALAKDLKTMCASSTGVDLVPGKKNVHSVHVQGHQVSAVTRLLEKKGLPSQLVKVTDKTGKAPKKQAAGGGKSA
ncbi:hypothetical protein LPJ64_003283 [Coemansia asiatica]|uniref:Ligatin n=1 Tax=Coemansia asiatica TaxID=1052880 RepID=A0A9W7XL52_9FUNG|nr:hypothetical protein LPJ64_003283 [Coemansia asiatica]